MRLKKGGGRVGFKTSEFLRKRFKMIPFWFFGQNSERYFFNRLDRMVFCQSVRLAVIFSFNQRSREIFWSVRNWYCLLHPGLSQTVYLTWHGLFVFGWSIVVWSQILRAKLSLLAFRFVVLDYLRLTTFYLR